MFFCHGLLSVELVPTEKLEVSGFRAQGILNPETLNPQNPVTARSGCYGPR